MRIVVTGAAGGIGRHVVTDLLEHGHEVTRPGSGRRRRQSSPGPAASAGPAGPIVRDPARHGARS